ncbi:MAG: hypothetical protein QOG96_5115, partial [Pseudonocardiales bacterium]|nr:hypothetical protein [Pseudonocardiales bacterium]
MDTSTIQINYVTEWWPLLLIGVSLLALVTTVLWVVAK